MNYEEARADLDELALEITTSTLSWSHSQRLDKLRSFTILTRRALQAASGSPNEPERRGSIEALLDRVERAVVAAAQREKLQENYEHG
ncbi:hypothetical protein [Stenotrophomonas sp. SY1]|uniref:hypothetical protein n=1 Tax=Stenotrophomonas sp. SY1 TaxID=477235 RepID=UPI001E5F8A4F|nr:hypothetical protein [Stenotrophomonas sp. SY1]MCD9087002.1 hypothetical protein [Stenotrophomonas sp. SY1]